MNYTSVTNLRWANAEHTLIDCVVGFDAFDEAVPFTANPNDKSNPSSKDIFDRCVAGDFGAISEYEPPAPPTDGEIVVEVRAQRNRLLLASDWTQLPDVPQATKDLWATYRQALRDVPQQEGFPQNVTWPTAPQ